jgi:hypothetical protein
MAAELVHKYCDTSQSQIGVFLRGIDYGTVHRLRRRFRERMAKDPAVRSNIPRSKRRLEVHVECRDLTPITQLPTYMSLITNLLLNRSPKT